MLKAFPQYSGVGDNYDSVDNSNYNALQVVLKQRMSRNLQFNGGDGFTVWGLKIDTPGKLARNTDGVDPGAGAKNITITHSYISTGDDDVACSGRYLGST